VNAHVHIELILKSAKIKTVKLLKNALAA